MTANQDQWCLHITCSPIPVSQVSIPGRVMAILPDINPGQLGKFFIFCRKGNNKAAETEQNTGTTGRLFTHKAANLLCCSSAA
jgi:hypothetical protein